MARGPPLKAASAATRITCRSGGTPARANGHDRRAARAGTFPVVEQLLRAMAARSTLPDRDSPSWWRDEVEELVELVGLLAEPAIHANRTA